MKHRSLTAAARIGAPDRKGGWRRASNRSVRALAFRSLFLGPWAAAAASFASFMTGSSDLLLGSGRCGRPCHQLLPAREEGMASEQISTRMSPYSVERVRNVLPHAQMTLSSL